MDWDASLAEVAALPMGEFHTLLRAVNRKRTAGPALAGRLMNIIEERRPQFPSERNFSRSLRTLLHLRMTTTSSGSAICGRAAQSWFASS
jgi:hypothetical protein